MLIGSGVGRVIDHGFAEAMSPYADRGPHVLQKKIAIKEKTTTTTAVKAHKILLN